MNILFSVALTLFVVVSTTCSAARGDCSKPRPKPGVRILAPKDGARLPNFSIIKFSCSLGYNYLSGDQQLVCVNGVWKAAESDQIRKHSLFKCKRNPCPTEEIANGGVNVSLSYAITYSCHRGYRMEGDSQAFCQVNHTGQYFVNKPPPECIDDNTTCEVPSIENVITRGFCVDADEVCVPGDEIFFWCNKPKIFTFNGFPTATCSPSGNWSVPLPSCRKIKACKVPEPPVNSNVTGKCCEVGSQLQYKCHPGFELANPSMGNSMKCLENEKWSIPKPKCKPIGAVACPDIPPENHLVVKDGLPKDRDVFLAYDEITFDCEPLYETSEQLLLMCYDDGEWDDEFPVCKLRGPCPRPPSILNGSILELEKNNSTLLSAGFETTIECDRGFRIYDGDYTNQCLGNVWEHRFPDCSVVKCSDPGIPANGIRIGDGFLYENTVSFQCKGKDIYTLIGSENRTCQANGRWSGFTTVCDDRESDCPDPGVPVNSVRQGNSFNFGDEVTYSCLSNDDYTLIGNSTRMCLERESGGYWSGEEIECLGRHEYTSDYEAGVTFGRSFTTAIRSSSKSVETRGRSLGGSSGTDIWFLLDASGSITDWQFNHAKDFASLVIRRLGISKSSGLRVGVIEFSTVSNVAITTAVTNVGEILKIIEDMKKSNKGTNLHEALEQLTGQVSPNRCARSRVAYIISDGKYNDGGEPFTVADTLRVLYCVKMFAISIGSDVSRENLIKITGDDKNILAFPEYKDIPSFAEKVLNENIDLSSCGLDRPHTIQGEEKSRAKRSMKDLARIVGGRKVQRPWPWMAALRYDTGPEWKVECGGSIIHKQWILTAAHCFKDGIKERLDPDSWRVVVGRTNMSDIQTGLEYETGKIILHQNYSDSNYHNDIALVKLRLVIRYDLFTRPVCLPPAIQAMAQSTELYKDNKFATVAGFGHTVKSLPGSEDAVVTNFLQELDVPLKSEEICMKSVEYYSVKNPKKKISVNPTKSMFCAGKADGKEDACQGDSGGPLMQFTESISKNNTQPRWFVIGVTSWGIGCAQEGYYGYYTHVSKLRQWINEITGVTFENAIP